MRLKDVPYGTVICFTGGPFAQEMYMERVSYAVAREKAGGCPRGTVPFAAPVPSRHGVEEAWIFITLDKNRPVEVTKTGFRAEDN